MSDSFEDKLEFSLGGILSNSTAIITDAAHMCIDALSFMMSLAAIYLAKKRPTQTLSFGYSRAGCNKIIDFQWTDISVSFRSSWCFVECIDYMVSHRHTCVYGY